MKFCIYIAVIIQQREGFEEEFKRCRTSVEEAMSGANYSVRIFTGHNMTREEILLQNLKEIKECDYVTFIDASDYVSEHFFEGIPDVVDKSTILASECFTTQYTCGELVLGRLNGFAGARISMNGPIVPVYEDGDCLLDCHVWGYFYPSSLILKDSFIKIISENMDRMGSCVYWSFFTKYRNLRVRILPNSRYYHMAIRIMEKERQLRTGNGFDYLLEINPFMKLAHEINPKFPLKCLEFPGRVDDYDDTKVLYSTSWTYDLSDYVFSSMFTNIADFIEIRKVGGFTKLESSEIREKVLDGIFIYDKLSRQEIDEFKELLNDEA